MKELNELLPPAEEAVIQQTDEGEEKVRLQRAVENMKKDIKLKEGQLQVEEGKSVIKFDTPRPKDNIGNNKNTSANGGGGTDKKKKRTFGKRSTNKGRNSRNSTESSMDTSVRGSSIASKKVIDVSEMPLMTSIHGKQPPKKVIEEIDEVLPTFDSTPEALPSPVYPVFDKPSTSDTLTEETKTTGDKSPSDKVDSTNKEEMSAPEVEKPLVISTGDGFIFQGRWKFDWLEMNDSSSLISEFPNLVLSQPPEVLAYRTDMGSEGSLVRCY